MHCHSGVALAIYFHFLAFKLADW